MGEIKFDSNPKMTSDYMVGDGNVGTEGTEGKQDVNGTGREWKSVFGGPSVTFEKHERAVVFATSNPELAPSANITPQERNECYESILKKFNRALGGTNGNRSMVFDMYAMMDLIQQMSQKLRNALRNLRKLENETIYANIMAQAAIQREAAIVGAVAGAVMCAIQAGVVVGGMIMQLKGAAVSSKTVGKGAMNSALKQEAMMKDLKAMTDGKSDAFAKQTFAYGSRNYPKDVEAVKTAKTNYLAAKDEYMRAKESVANGGKIPSSKLNELKSNMETARMDYDAAREVQVDHLKSALNCKCISKADFDTAMEGMSNDVEELRSISKLANSPKNGTDGQQNMIRGMVVQQVGMALGNFLSQLASSIREVISSKVTELQAEQKLTEEQFDQIKELFSLVQSVIQKAIDVFAAVVQKESSVIEGILQHV